VGRRGPDRVQDAIPMGSATAGNLINALNSNTLPTYSLVAPNLCNDTHDCGVPAGDQFLKTLLPQVFSSPAYRFGKTAVFVVWDEDSYIPNIVIAPSVIPGTAAATAVNHYGLLRATRRCWGCHCWATPSGPRRCAPCSTSDAVLPDRTCEC
jgi:phospholipase C